MLPSFKMHGRKLGGRRRPETVRRRLILRPRHSSETSQYIALQSKKSKGKSKETRNFVVSSTKSEVGKKKDVSEVKYHLNELKHRSET